ncbi:hypothetical protein DERF_013629 [Dermatophagoides farinae]|uniref:Guanylate cyclase domain-containing protein n=1 Tax=Dermatophagoides farinae TaxID=6954 RepID=A0A922HMS8_DERFA|nr:hypothetical protein DERF_013629 [Dermatophagoides farinae]
MKIQISEVTQRLLDPNEWIIRERGTIRLKGKGMMKTYWLEYRKDRMNKNQLDSRLKNVSDNDDDISDVDQQKNDGTVIIHCLLKQIVLNGLALLFKQND